LALLSGTLMVLDYRGASTLTPVRSAFTMLLYPLQYTVDLPYRGATFTKEFFSKHSEMSGQNRELRTLINVYAARDQKYYSIAEENQRLRTQLKAVPAVREKFTLSEILSVSSDPFRQDVVINKGIKEGLFIGQVALAGKNIYGQVKSVTANSAVVMRLTDVKHAIPVRNNRTGEGALAVGSGKDNILELKNIESHIDVQAGDIFFSSGLGQLFPADFPVAVVRSVAYNPGDSFRKVKAQTLADFTKTREILMIWRSDYASSDVVGAIDADIDKNESEQKEAALVKSKSKTNNKKKLKSKSKKKTKKSKSKKSKKTKAKRKKKVTKRKKKKTKSRRANN